MQCLSVRLVKSLLPFVTDNQHLWLGTTRAPLPIKHLLSPLRSWLVTNQRSPDLRWKSEQKFTVQCTRPSFPRPNIKEKNSGLATRDYQATKLVPRVLVLPCVVSMISL